MSEPRGGDANGDPNIAACVLGEFLYVAWRKSSLGGIGVKKTL